MSLDFLIKLLGWTMVLSPPTVFVVLTSYMVWGAAKDDEIIMGLVMGGMAIFAVGAAILFLSYTTTLLAV